MNKVVLIGNLCRDPQLRTTDNGTSVCSFTVAVNRRFKDQNGETVTDFFRVTTWRQLAESCGKYLTKGRKVAVIGELQARLYEAKDGTTKMSLDVSADEVEFLTAKSDTENTAQETAPTEQPQTDANGFTDINPMDLPF